VMFWKQHTAPWEMQFPALLQIQSSPDFPLEPNPREWKIANGCTAWSSWNMMNWVSSFGGPCLAQKTPKIVQELLGMCCTYQCSTYLVFMCGVIRWLSIRLLLHQGMSVLFKLTCWRLSKDVEAPCSQKL
jgi:hypothetical protein